MLKGKASAQMTQNHCYLKAGKNDLLIIKNNTMDNFLTTLYFERFQAIEREKRLRNNHDWEDSATGRADNIRNDQSISEVSSQVKMIDRFIDAYVEKIKRE